jgi:DNA recombination protein RmuC
MSLELIVLLASWLLFIIILILLIVRKAGRRDQVEVIHELSLLERVLNRVETISSHIDELSSVFLIPHVRGGIGETLLELLLANWLPEDSYTLQHKFRNGYRADAVIKLGSYKVVVDSKFPLESIKRSAAENENKGNPFKMTSDLKRTLIRHGRDISEKYIQPDEGTLNFALMYIPSEKVYYHSFVEDSEISAELIKIGVIPVSPSSLFLYLQTVAYGLKGFVWQEGARDTLNLLNQLKKETEELSKAVAVSGTHISNLYKSYDSVTGRVNKLDVLLQRIDKM